MATGPAVVPASERKHRGHLVPWRPELQNSQRVFLEEATGRSERGGCRAAVSVRGSAALPSP